MDNSTKKFNNNMKQLTNLKDSIEQEMTKIDKAFEKVNKETTIAFELKRKKINKEEQDLKEKLRNEVTKTKENLEKNLSQINNLFKECEKILKGIQIFEKEEKNMIKTLSYISKITKNQKEFDQLNQQSMKNLKITFDEQESIIKYEEYYFNGINEINLKENMEKALINESNNNLKNIINNFIEFKEDHNYKIEMENQNEEIEKVEKQKIKILEDKIGMKEEDEDYKKREKSRKKGKKKKIIFDDKLDNNYNLINNNINNKELNNIVIKNKEEFNFIHQKEDGEEEYSYQCENTLLLYIYIFEGTEEAKITLTLSNNGNKPWPRNTKLIFDNNSIIKGDEIILNEQKPGEKNRYEIKFKNLKDFFSGEYRAYLIFNVNGKKYGEILTIIVVIK